MSIRLTEAQENLSRAKEALQAPFPQAEKLKQTKERLREINKDLELDKKENDISCDVNNSIDEVSDKAKDSAVDKLKGKMTFSSNKCQAAMVR